MRSEGEGCVRVVDSEWCSEGASEGGGPMGCKSAAKR